MASLREVFQLPEKILVPRRMQDLNASRFGLRRGWKRPGYFILLQPKAHGIIGIIAFCFLFSSLITIADCFQSCFWESLWRPWKNFFGKTFPLSAGYSVFHQQLLSFKTRQRFKVSQISRIFFHNDLVIIDSRCNKWDPFREAARIFFKQLYLGNPFQVLIL